MCRWELLPWISHGSVLLVPYCWFACDVTAAMLMVKNKSISLVWEQNSIFMYIIQEKIYCIDSQHGCLQLSHGCKPRNYTWKTWWLSIPAASEHSDNLPETSEHCQKCPNIFQRSLSTSKAISKVTILAWHVVIQLQPSKLKFLLSGHLAICSLGLVTRGNF